jgi:hypothetical protein
MLQRKVTPWVVEERERLLGLGVERQGKDLALDLAELFVGDLREKSRRCLTLVSRPDEDDRNAPAPDFVYEDRAAGIRAVLEVTRPLVQSTQRQISDRTKFRDEVLSDLPDAFRGQYLLVIDPSWVPPRDRRGRQELARQVAQSLDLGRQTLPPMPDDPLARRPGEQRIELRPVLPGFALRGDEATRPTELILFGSSEPWPAVAPTVGEGARNLESVREDYLQWYRCILREADCKLARYACGGCETFLLLDRRLDDHLSLYAPRRLKGWHDHAYKNPGAPWVLNPITQEDFLHIHHILAFCLPSSGVSVSVLWQAPNVRLTTCLEWSIKPPGWHDD